MPVVASGWPSRKLEQGTHLAENQIFFYRHITHFQTTIDAYSPSCCPISTGWHLSSSLLRITSVTLLMHSTTNHGSVHLQTGHILIRSCYPGRNTQALSRRGQSNIFTYYKATANKTLPLLSMDSQSSCIPQPFEVPEEDTYFLCPHLAPQKTGQLHDLML